MDDRRDDPSYYRSFMSDGDQEAYARPSWFRRDGYSSQMYLYESALRDAQRKLEKAAYGLQLAITLVKDLETARELGLILEDISR